jgi:hypothetical protein
LPTPHAAADRGPSLNISIFSTYDTNHHLSQSNPTNMEDAAAMMERRIFIAFLAGLGAVACAAAWAAGVPAGVIAAATVAFAVLTFYHWNHAIGARLI